MAHLVARYPFSFGRRFIGWDGRAMRRTWFWPFSSYRESSGLMWVCCRGAVRLAAPAFCWTASRPAASSQLVSFLIEVQHRGQVADRRIRITRGERRKVEAAFDELENRD